VVGARRRANTARRERLGATLVGPEPPADSGRLVDSAPDERVPETEAAGDVGGANEVELQELVEGLDRSLLGGGRCGRRQLGLEWIARHRCSFEYETSAVG
jgi:hypothetical protein